MKPTVCEGCDEAGDGGACLRYGKPRVRVKACGKANRGYNRRPFSRKGAENLRKRREEEEEKHV